jgi:hypothetical protein
VDKDNIGENLEMIHFEELTNEGWLKQQCIAEEEAIEMVTAEDKQLTRNS